MSLTPTLRRNGQYAVNLTIRHVGLTGTEITRAVALDHILYGTDNLRPGRRGKGRIEAVLRHLLADKGVDAIAFASDQIDEYDDPEALWEWARAQVLRAWPELTVPEWGAA